VEDLTFPLLIGDTVSIGCSLLYGGAWAAGLYSSELAGGAQDPLLVLNFGARSIPVTSINQGVVRLNMTKNGVKK